MRPLRGFFVDKDYPDLIAGLGEPDDAAIWRLDEDRALVITTDFFTPVVDDPFDYGAIAAVNSISDIYAMGGSPFLALNIAALPPHLPLEVSSEILRGGAEMAKKANIVIAGGHTIQDKEPKYGLVVLGFVDPNKMLKKGGAKPGDILMISKPTGIGIITTALKNGNAEQEHVQMATYWMKQFNKNASDLSLEFNAHAATDITGFSLLGHTWEMASASKVGIHLSNADIPFIEGAESYAEKWIFPGGCFDNEKYFSPHVEFEDGIENHKKYMLFDPQTSGGLLIAVPPEYYNSMLEKAKQIDQPLWKIGEVIEGDKIYVGK